ncbi:MAG: hypoxanthine phosphoribosyltransferase [Bacteroidetes bacterium]|nr:hypoxanthine phosphoribosyltransferase [Bacteroidota bacterium]
MNSNIDSVQLRELHFELLYPAARIQARVEAIGQALSQSHAGKNPIFLSILSGAFVFASDLIRCYQGDCEVSFVKLSSYSGTASSGAVQTVFGLGQNLSERHVVVVEDIVDTGRTLHYFRGLLEEQQPASITVVTLLRKPDALEFPVPLDHIGFDISNLFVVGYGLDYDGLGRNLPGIYQLKEQL